jgi:hypothetical protein
VSCVAKFVIIVRHDERQRSSFGEGEYRQLLVDGTAGFAASFAVSIVSIKERLAERRLNE